jgi:hypothetical protein
MCLKNCLKKKKQFFARLQYEKCYEKWNFQKKKRKKRKTHKKKQNKKTFLKYCENKRVLHNRKKKFLSVFFAQKRQKGSKL